MEETRSKGDIDTKVFLKFDKEKNAKRQEVCLNFRAAGTLSDIGILIIYVATVRSFDSVCQKYTAPIQPWRLRRNKHVQSQNVRMQNISKSSPEWHFDLNRKKRENKETQYSRGPKKKHCKCEMIKFD